jgi:hypothetical protein
LIIISRATKIAATTTQTKKTMTNTPNGICFSRTATGPKSAGPVGTGRSPTFVPVMINFESPVAGGCGTVIFWKHVGHSITVLLRHDSHLICWPQTGQANLNSLMIVWRAFHIHALAAIRFFAESRDISE